jgi:hypothetical protein
VDVIIACGACGADPATDSLLILLAMSAGISAPWFLRSRLMRLLDTLRGQRSGSAQTDGTEACPIDVAEREQRADA